jgi:membrane associated rhomboid family serine protease
MASLIPISDDNPTSRRAWVTLALIATNIVVYLLQPGPVSFAGTPVSTEVFFLRHSPPPCSLDSGCAQAVREIPRGNCAGDSVAIGTNCVAVPDRSALQILEGIFVSMFLHASILHVGGNMLFLWVFGNNIEDWLGRIRYIFFYLAGGLISSLAEMVANIHSPIGAVGASGAVAAVLGAYFVLYPKARVNVLVPIFFFFTLLPLSAWLVLGLWVLFQVFVPQPGVAWQAHVAGFIFGALLILALGRRPQRPSDSRSIGRRGRRMGY